MLSLEEPTAQISKGFLSVERVTEMRTNWEIVLENCQSGIQTTFGKRDGEESLMNIYDDMRLGCGYYIVRGLCRGIDKDKRVSDNLYEYDGETMKRLDDRDSLTIMHRLLRAKNDRVRELLAEKSDYIDCKDINNLEY
jgi:hypothetical protein